MNSPRCRARRLSAHRFKIGYGHLLASNRWEYHVLTCRRCGAQRSADPDYDRKIGHHIGPCHWCERGPLRLEPSRHVRGYEIGRRVLVIDTVEYTPRRKVF